MTNFTILLRLSRARLFTLLILGIVALRLILLNIIVVPFAIELPLITNIIYVILIALHQSFFFKHNMRNEFINGLFLLHIVVSGYKVPIVIKQRDKCKMDHKRIIKFHLK
jgi:hypothetical protein